MMSLKGLFTRLPRQGEMMRDENLDWFGWGLLLGIAVGGLLMLLVGPCNAQSTSATTIRIIEESSDSIVVEREIKVYYPCIKWHISVRDIVWDPDDKDPNNGTDSIKAYQLCDSTTIDTVIYYAMSKEEKFRKDYELRHGLSNAQWMPVSDSWITPDSSQRLIVPSDSGNAIQLQPPDSVICVPREVDAINSPQFYSGTWSNEPVTWNNPPDSLSVDYHSWSAPQTMFDSLIHYDLVFQKSDPVIWNSGTDNRLGMTIADRDKYINDGRSFIGWKHDKPDPVICVSLMTHNAICMSQKPKGDAQPYSVIYDRRVEELIDKTCDKFSPYIDASHPKPDPVICVSSMQHKCICSAQKAESATQPYSVICRDVWVHAITSKPPSSGLMINYPYEWVKIQICDTIPREK